jgi:hypothetical protein
MRYLPRKIAANDEAITAMAGNSENIQTSALQDTGKCICQLIIKSSHFAVYELMFHRFSFLPCAVH